MGNIIDNKDKKRLFSNFFSLFSLQLFTYILPLITFPYLVRVLGVDKFGLVMFAQAFIMFFSVLTDYGFNLSATREIAINRENSQKIAEIYSSVLILKIFLVLIAGIILSAIIFLFERFRNDLCLYYLYFLWVVGNTLFPSWYFQGIEKMKYITIVNITSKLISTLAIFFFIHNESDYLLVPLLQAIGAIAGTLYSYILLNRRFKQKIRLQPLSVLSVYFIDSTRFFLSRLSVNVYTSANTFVLGIFTNTTLVGYYSIAEKLYQAIQTLYSPLVQVLYPYISKVGNVVFFKRVFYIITTLNILGAIVLYFSSELLFKLIFDNPTAYSISVFYILLVANLVTVPSILLGYPFLGALGLSKIANDSVIYASLLHFWGIVILIGLESINIYNIAVMVVVTELFVLIYRVFHIYKERLWQKQ